MNITTARRRIQDQAHLNAFISTTTEEGSGSPIAVKDLIDVRGTVTTAGSMIRPPVVAAEDAPVIRRIRAHHGVVVGKTNLNEWALGVTGYNPHYGVVRNPRDPRRIAGGSSSGSAAAVASGMCDWAIGTDTGGSIRIPASLCGVVGIKPSFGLVSMQGVVPLSRTLDAVGPLAPDVSTAARALEMISDFTGPASVAPADSRDPRLAVPAGWVDALDDETTVGWARVSAGLPRIPFPARAEMSDAALTILLFEAAAFHRERMAQHADAYGAEVLHLLRRGAAIRQSEYTGAMESRDPLHEMIVAAMHGWDAVLLPATACVAPLIGDRGVSEPLSRFSRAFNLTGQPVVCLPAPVDGLPVGIQVVGHRGQDARLIAVARRLEAAWTAASG